MFVKFVNIFHQRIGDMFNDVMMLCLFFSKNHGTLRLMRSPKSSGNWRSLYKPCEKTYPNLSCLECLNWVLGKWYMDEDAWTWPNWRLDRNSSSKGLPSFEDTSRHDDGWKTCLFDMCLGLVGHVQVIKLRQFSMKFGIEELRKCLLKYVYAQR